MPAAGHALRCVISIDVEEEGLFRGRYDTAPRAENVRHLDRLLFCNREFGVPLTLLVAYPVTRDPRACEVLQRLHAMEGAEIGAHLHHWNTPPLVQLPHPEPVRCRLLPEELLRSKLETLTVALEEKLGVRPRSFRMGRFDYCEKLTPLLLELGYVADSSFAPLRCQMHGPDHFAWRAELGELAPGLREVPLTTVPVLEPAARAVEAAGRLLPYAARTRLQRGFGKAFCAGVHPLWFSLASMKLATRLHVARGGRVLNMFLHSSELMPGGSPQVPDEATAQALADRIRRWLEWLCNRYTVQGCTLSRVQ